MGGPRNKGLTDLKAGWSQGVVTMEKLFYVLAYAALYASAAFETMIEEEDGFADAKALAA